MRKIIHLDMDCFYAAIEMREHPELGGIPVAVGGGGPRSVVASCNYLARAFGVRSGMPGFMAQKRCPNIHFVPVSMQLYQQEAKRLQAIFREYTQLVEPLSLDEAFLDVTHVNRYAWDIAKELRARIAASMRLTSSAGIAPNKMLAKIASDWKKPNGQFAILPEQVPLFMHSLPVQKIWGVGPKSLSRFHALGIKTCADLQQRSFLELTERFGKWGQELYELCRGNDKREVVSNRLRKSLSNETTFLENLTSLKQCIGVIKELAQELIAEWQLKAPQRQVRKVFVKIKFADFKRTTKECLCANPEELVYSRLLTEAYERSPLPIRLLGTGIRFVEEVTTDQLELF